MAPGARVDDLAVLRRRARSRARDASRAQHGPATGQGLLGGRGAPGPAGGRVLMRTRIPGVVETTKQLAATYPFLTGGQPGILGPYIGRDRFGRGEWTWDSYRAYSEGVITNPSVFVAGTVGSGKSSLVKSMCAVRASAFGRRFLVPADQKGEYAALARALGVTPVQFGPGMNTCLNPLEPPRPPAAAAGEAEWVGLVARHQRTTLTAMAEAGMARTLLPEERTALDLALEWVTRGGTPGRWATPVLAEVTAALLEPDLTWIRGRGVRDADRLAAASFGLGCQLRTLVHGVYRGLFDGRTTVRVDLDAPGVVIDMSRVRSDDASLALSMTAAQAHLELAVALDPRPRYLIYDESWRVVQFHGLLRRLGAAIKLSREGHVPVVVVHRVSDLVTGDPVLDAAAEGLLADIDVRILYHQAPDQLERTQALCGLGDVETALLPALEQGSALWRVGRRAHLVDHVVPVGGLEWEVLQTDSRMTGEYRSVPAAPQQLAAVFGPPDRPDTPERLGGAPAGEGAAAGGAGYGSASTAGGA